VLLSIPAVCATVIACGDNNGPVNTSSTATTQTANATVASIGDSNTPVVANPTLADKAAAIIGSWGAGDSCIVENGVDLPGGIQIAKSMNIVRRFDIVDAATLRVTRTGNVVAGRTHVLFTEQSGNKGLFAVSADKATVIEGKRTVLSNVIQVTHGGNVQSTTRPTCSVGSYSRGPTLVPSNTRVTLQSASPTVLVVDRTSGLGLYDSSKYVAISSGLIQALGF
jgi:hypothetical protein